MPLKHTGKSKKITIKARESEYISKVPFPPFEFTVFIVFTDNVVQTANNLAEQGFMRKNHEIDATTGAFTVRNLNGYTILVFPQTTDSGQIGHEAYHAVCCMMNWIGAENEEEITAYVLGYLIQFIHTDLEIAKKKEEKKKLLAIDKS